MKKIYIVISVVLTLLMLCSCGKTKEIGEVSSVASGETVKSDISTEEMDFEFTNNDLNYGYDEASAVTVGENEATVKITAEGTYLVTGKHTQILVSAPDTAKIKIVLNNATIENNAGPAIYIAAADIFILNRAALTSPPKTTELRRKPPLKSRTELSLSKQAAALKTRQLIPMALICAALIPPPKHKAQRIPKAQRRLSAPH